MTLSTPVKIVALAALALAFGAAGVVLLLGGSHTSPAAPAIAKPAVQLVHVHTTAPHHVAASKPVLKLDTNLPAPVHRALELSREVVAFVYSPASPSDEALLSQAREGAHEARVGFVPLDVQRESVAASVFSWSSSASDPVVMVVRRPGRIAFTLAGATDSAAVAQAAASAR